MGEGPFCILNVIFRGGLYKVAYTNPFSPLLINFTQINGGGGGGRAWALVPMPVTVVMPGFVNKGLKRRSEATERGGGGYASMGGGTTPPPTVGIF